MQNIRRHTHTHTHTQTYALLLVAAQAVEEDEDAHHAGHKQPVCVEPQPREVDGNLLPKVVADCSCVSVCECVCV